MADPCVYCGKPANAIDHVVPRSRGGGDDPRNRVPCCKSCNSRKKDRLPSWWLKDKMTPEIRSIEAAALDSVDMVLPKKIREEDREISLYVSADVYRMLADVARRDGMGTSVEGWLLRLAGIRAEFMANKESSSTCRFSS